MGLVDLNPRPAAARSQEFGASGAFGAAPSVSDRSASVGGLEFQRAGNQQDIPLRTRAAAVNDGLGGAGPADVAKQVSVQASWTHPNCTSKRALDFVLALVGIVLLLPLLIAVAVAVRLEMNGPVLFCQYRGGRNGRCFRILKFRTMVCLEDGVEVCQARSCDPRITRLGRILRRTSLDELPQLFNVILGDMSLVGPRPHALVHDAMYSQLIANYSSRQTVRPGMTGWAQVNGCRGETREITAMERRVQYDLEYIRQGSFWLDALIMARTIVEVLRSKNAY